MFTHHSTSSFFKTQDTKEIDLSSVPRKYHDLSAVFSVQMTRPRTIGLLTLLFLRPWLISVHHWSVELQWWLNQQPWIILIVQLLNLILLPLQPDPDPWSDSRVLLANSELRSCKTNKCPDSASRLNACFSHLWAQRPQLDLPQRLRPENQSKNNLFLFLCELN